MISKKIIWIIIIIYIFAFIALIVFDNLNIKGSFQLTETYDWLSFLGGYFAGFGALILGMVSIFQNENLSKINKETMENNIISTSFSNIQFTGIQFLQFEKKFMNNFGIKLKNETISNIEEDNNCFRMALRLRDKQGKPLMTACITNIEITYNLFNGKNEHKFVNIDSNDVELTDESENGNVGDYFLRVILYDNNANIEKIKNAEKITVVINMAIKNSFNTVSEFRYSADLIKEEKISNFGVPYRIKYGKVFYKGIFYHNKSKLY